MSAYTAYILKNFVIDYNFHNCNYNNLLVNCNRISAIFNCNRIRREFLLF